MLERGRGGYRGQCVPTVEKSAAYPERAGCVSRRPVTSRPFGPGRPGRVGSRAENAVGSLSPATLPRSCRCWVRAHVQSSRPRDPRSVEPTVCWWMIPVRSHTIAVGMAIFARVGIAPAASSLVATALRASYPARHAAAPTPWTVAPYAALQPARRRRLWATPPQEHHIGNSGETWLPSPLTAGTMTYEPDLDIWNRRPSVSR